MSTIIKAENLVFSYPDEPEGHPPVLRGIDLEIEQHRTLAPELLKKWKEKGWRIVGLEQTNDSYWLHEYAFPEKTLLVVGNERLGIEPEILKCLDDVVEIPMYGLPFSHNAATATAIAMYEYCRQHLR